MPMPEIDLAAPTPKATLFDTDAQNVAEELRRSAAGKKMNTNTQLRRFYDELVGWQERIGDDQAKFDHHVAFIKMLNAKAAYAKGRNPPLVTQDFVDWFSKCVRTVNTPASLKHFRLHFEATLGFLKAIPETDDVRPRR